MDLQLFGIIAALVLSAWFAGSETVFLSFNKARLQLRTSRMHTTDRMVRFLAERPERFLVTTLTGNTLAAALYSSLFAIWLTRRGVPEQVVLITAPLLLLVVGEATPKAVARRGADAAVRFVGVGLFLVRLTMLPVMVLVEPVFSWLVRRFQVGESDMGILLSRADIVTMLRSAGRHGVINPVSAELLKRMFLLSELRVGDIMTPRIRVEAVPVDMSIEEVRRLILESGFTRIPCYRDDRDEIVGFILAHDLLQRPHTLESVLRPLPMVPETMRVTNLMGWLSANHAGLAGVIDEYGSFSGVVGPEDIAEELVGRIRDEYDERETELLRLTDRVWLAAGSTRLSILQQALGEEFKVKWARTVAGMVLQLAGGIPKQGREFTVPGARLRVVRASPRGVGLVRITLQEPREGRAES